MKDNLWSATVFGLVSALALGAAVSVVYSEMELVREPALTAAPPAPITLALAAIR